MQLLRLNFAVQYYLGRSQETLLPERAARRLAEKGRLHKVRQEREPPLEGSLWRVVRFFAPLGMNGSFTLAKFLPPCFLQSVCFFTLWVDHFGRAPKILTPPVLCRRNQPGQKSTNR